MRVKSIWVIEIRKKDEKEWHLLSVFYPSREKAESIASKLWLNETRKYRNSWKTRVVRFGRKKETRT